ncbi:MAG: c-type cytochrome, partial [Steroidobacteraceae bacterium]|nr:c-type cytochrome [Steroidobacteraceae bacterium]
GLASIAQAQSPAPAADAKRGHALAYTCNGCHAIPNYKNVYPTYSVPKLRGQKPEYLVAALKAYKSGERSHGTMHSQAVTMTEEDMRDVAVFLAGPKPLTEMKSDVPPDKRPKATEICKACHGTNGVGLLADQPNIGGQHEDYLERALHDYQRGGRKNVIMAGMVQALTAEDIKLVAEYYSKQKPALETVPNKAFFFSAN